MSNHTETWLYIIENMKTSNTYKYIWAKSIITICKNVNTPQNELVIKFDQISELFVKFYWDLINLNELNIGPLNSKPSIQTLIEKEHQSICNILNVQVVSFDQVAKFYRINLDRFNKLIKEINNIIHQDVCWRFQIVDDKVFDIYRLDRDDFSISLSNEVCLELKNESEKIINKIDEFFIIELQKYNRNKKDGLKKNYEFIYTLRESAELANFEVENMHNEFKEKFIENFLNKLNIDFRNKYSYKFSVVQYGKVISFWWAGIFDKEFYKDIYHRGIPGASSGYYLVYLFNEKRDKVYLSLDQAAKDISLNINKEKLYIYKKKNEWLRENLFKDSGFIENLEGHLTPNKLKIGIEYEYSSLIAKGYDLNRDIENEEFINDIKIFLNYYKLLINFIKKEKSFEYEDYIVNLCTQEFKKLESNINFDEYEKQEDEQKVIHNSNPYLAVSEIMKQNKRIPEKLLSNQSKYKRDSRLAKTVLKNKSYKCEVDENHITFIMANNTQYSEAHHFIPMKFQGEFAPFNLDRTENIVSLCPICHNAIHYGNAKEKNSRLIKLFENEERKAFIKENFDIDDYFDFIKKFY